MNNNPFIKRILLLGVVPVITSAVMIIAGFFWIQNNQLEKTRRHFVSLVENTFLAKPTQLGDNQLLEDLQPLLYIDPISNISITDEKRNILAQKGLPLDRSKLDSLDLQINGKTVAACPEELILAIPFKTPSEQKWFVSIIKTSSLRESLYQGIILTVIVSGICLALIILFSQRLSHSILAPLKRILRQLRSNINSGHETEIDIKSSAPFIDLAETVNELISMQHSAQDEMQNNVEQSTKELRETLETVEIQNIELDIARKNALLASQAKSEFLANTSHELRTPLNGIIGFTSLLLKTGLTNQQKDYLSTIEQSAQGLLTVINDILDFSKLETGQLTLEYKPIYVRELIEDVFSIYAPQAHEKNIHLLSIVNHNVPRNLLGDPQRLKQVLTNLISNSIKFSARGNIIVRCSAISEMDSRIEIKFNISDNGIGLTEEQQENLFSAFTKVDNSDSRLQGGTGLGLAIAKGLVDRMQGDIGVESEPRSGSTFWFTVRLGVDKQRISQSPLMNSLYGIRIFVYDANDMGRTEITHLLSSWGVSYIEESTFNNVYSTLSLRQKDGINLIVLDAYTKENQFDKTQLIKEITRINTHIKTPIILLAPPAIQRSIQDDLVGLNTLIVQRPIEHNIFHQSICHLLNIAEPLSTNITKESIPQEQHTGVRVLVVDDNAANRKLVHEFLTPLGAVTECAESGYEAIELTKDNQFDLILMDVQMPGMDGLETTKLIRSKETVSRTPIVALTAHAVAEQKTKLLLSGMDDFLSKPVSEEDLVHIIQRWVKREKNSATIYTTQQEPKLEDPVLESEQESTSRVGDIFSWTDSMKLTKNNAKLATDMLEMLIDSLDETQQFIRQHLEHEDYDALFEVNHKFHGGCSYCGVPALKEATGMLESCLVKKDYANASTLTHNVLNNISKLKEWSAEHDIRALFLDS